VSVDRTILIESSECFSHLEDNERSKAIRLLGLIPCASAGSLTVTRDRHGEIRSSECTVCDTTESLPHPAITKSTHDETVVIQAIAVLSTLIKTPEFESSRKPRILAMIGLRKFALHSEATQFMDLEESTLGQWCLSSLRSSVRELRITAGRTLPAFLRDVKDLQISRKNRVNALNLLKEFSEQSPMHLTETWVLAWGRIARASKDRELNLALLRLVEYLGHTNQIISAVAFNEILNTAEAQGVPVGQMFSPFWRTIAHTAVKDLQSRPQTAQLLAELLSISVSEFLVNTQAHTLPWLVLDRKTDVIARISQARDDKDPSEAILENMAAIMPHLLVQNVPDIEIFIMQLLRNVSSRFNDIDLVECVRMAAIEIALELLKNAGDEDDSRKSRVSIIYLHPMLLLISNIDSTRLEHTSWSLQQ
jgi:serine/threonine-protein kinase ATR